MHNNIGYHTRLIRDNTVKVCGGSFGGAIDVETVNRLVAAHFTVRVTPSGRAVFVDREGREVSLYLTVDASDTPAGKAALREHRRQREKEDEAKQSALDDLLSTMTADEAIRRLTEGHTDA